MLAMGYFSNYRRTLYFRNYSRNYLGIILGIVDKFKKIARKSIGNFKSIMNCLIFIMNESP